MKLLCASISIFFFSCELARPQVVADSVLDFSLTQGSNNWFYGYYANPGPNLSLATFVQLGDTTEDYWHHAGEWEPPWTTITETEMHPNASTSPGGLEWAVRRWVAPADMTINVSGHVAKADTEGGNGVIAVALVNGTRAFTTTIAANDDTGFDFSFTTNVTVGAILDFAIGPNGNDLFDATVYTILINQVPEPGVAAIGSIGLTACVVGHRWRHRKRRSEH